MKRFLFLALLALLLAGCTKKTKVIVYADPQADTCKAGHGDDRDDRLPVLGKPLAQWEAEKIPELGASPVPGMRGELTGDGFVDVLDAVLLAQFYDGRIGLDTAIIANANINCDGVYSRADVFSLVDFLNSKGIGAGNGVADSMPCFQ